MNAALSLHAVTSEALQDLFKAATRANLVGELTDEEASSTFEQIAAEQRRRSGKGPIQASLAFKPPKRRPIPTERLMARRKRIQPRWLPPQVAQHLTLGQQAVASAVARVIARKGKCTMSVATLMSEADVSETVVHNFLREGAAEGLISVEARTHPGRRSDTNLVTITNPEWRQWLKLRERGGRVQKDAPNPYPLYQSEPKTTPTEPQTVGKEAWRALRARL